MPTTRSTLVILVECSKEGPPVQTLPESEVEGSRISHVDLLTSALPKGQHSILVRMYIAVISRRDFPRKNSTGVLCRHKKLAGTYV